MKIYDALKSIPSNKSEGNVGLSKEFYICFFDVIGHTLRQSLNNSLDKRELSSFQRQAIIT